MFIKITHSGPRRYVQLVEAYRDDTGRPRQPVAGLSSISQEQTDILGALTIKKPSLNTQLTLL
ncbi:hypothetical protein [Simplicispira hankyongi]|uniref:IS1634 family transposase n=1 Tax=Simplicispira hankyongi TaxID=2315688 RepID=A0A398C6J2_9BURK|nr:hypothetical protein [Simplicispira hankyongi]RID96867.1 hypothetical protein D3F03_17055 [Simplicispira hankyongi]